ncbi:tape measure protein [Roseibium aggregatum]|uniref:Tape measure domain protein n=1 Tax=Roseibium aggregatum TaxID=187304 RepID=A0A0M6Y6P9_9HYPH|nr:tape measure domain protein [Roseibium aggregatum]
MTNTERRISVVIDASRAEAGARRVTSALNDIRGAGERAENGLNRTENGVRRLNRSSGGLISSLGQVRAALAGVGAALGLREIARIADTYQLIDARLKLATGSAQKASVAFAELRALADDTGQSFSGTAELFTSLQRATADLGTSQEDLMSTTRTINNLVRVSGADAQSAAAAITQLSQGLASGTLRGDEFNSVAEQLPAILEVISQATGKTRGELREMAAQGQITAELVLTSLLGAADGAQALADGMGQTIGQAYQRATNAVEAFIAALSQNTGFANLLKAALNGLASSFDFLTANVDTVVKLLQAGAFAAAPAIFLQIASAARVAGAAIAIAFSANPIGLLITAIGLAAGVLTAFRDDIEIVAGTGITLGDAMTVAWGYVKDAISAVGEAVQGAGNYISEIASAAESLIPGIGEAFKTTGETIAQVVRGWYNLVIGAFIGIPQAAASALQLMVKVFVTAFSRVREITLAAMNDVKNIIATLGQDTSFSNLKAEIEKGFDTGFSEGATAIIDTAVGNLTRDYVGEAASELQAVADAAKSELDSRLVNARNSRQANEFAAADSASVDAFNSQGQAAGTNYFGDNTDRINQETAAILNQAGARGANASAASAEGAAKKAASMVEDLTRENELLQQVQQGRYSSLETAQQELAIRKQLTGATEQQIQKVIELKAANDNLKTSLENQRQLGEQIGSTIASSFEDAIFSGKSLQEVLKGLALDLAKLIFRATVGRAITNFFGGLFGGGGGLPLPFANGGAFMNGHVVPFANGGAFVNRPTPFPMTGGRTGLMGEAGPEAIIPLARGRNGKLGVQMSGAASETRTTGGNVISFGDVNVTVEGNNRDGAEIGEEASREFMRQVEQKMDERIFNAQRPGGLLHKVA